ncbi:MAG: hypothetical protein PHH16_00225 [Candidatus Gracilibacteria bacterium]|nr:hypothetical protein [Candidatus Gracilibacteria bacterium]
MKIQKDSHESVGLLIFMWNLQEWARTGDIFGVERKKEKANRIWLSVERVLGNEHPTTVGATLNRKSPPIPPILEKSNFSDFFRKHKNRPSYERRFFREVALGYGDGILVSVVPGR